MMHAKAPKGRRKIRLPDRISGVELKVLHPVSDCKMPAILFCNS